MISYNVNVPEDKNSFFQEFLEMIGADYQKSTQNFQLREEQIKILLDQEDISIDDCSNSDDFLDDLKKKYEL